jgi:hypothetical protein
MTHSTHLPAAPAKKNGRPLKNDPPRLPHHEVDRLLVHGELIEGEDGAPPTVVYPSYRDLARRYGVNHSVVAAYAKKHNCLHRREVAQARVSARSDEKLIEQRAAALAFGRAEVMRIIDRYIGAFEAALADGRVRCDNPTDFNTMLRLKEYLDGGPDSRKEVTAGITLEALQARYGNRKTAPDAGQRNERRSTDVLQNVATATHPSPLQLEVQPRLLEQHLAKMPAPARRSKIDERLGLRVEVATTKARLAAPDLDEAFAVAVEAFATNVAGYDCRDVPRDDLALGVREHTGLRQRLAERERDRDHVADRKDAREARLKTTNGPSSASTPSRTLSSSPSSVGRRAQTTA